MSLDPDRKPNPLDNFRSVSYHHLLLVSNNTEALRPFINLTSSKTDSSGNVTETTIEQNRTGLESLNKTIDNAQFGDNINGAFKIIDTRKDGHFNIKDIHYTSNVGAMVPGQTQVMSGALTMVIHDPSGIGFLNYLQDLIDNQLKCNFDGLCFLLKTFFVGHPDDGTTDVLVSTSANPLFLQDISAEFNEMGGIYTVLFAPLTLGAIQQMSRTANIRNITGFKSIDGTLGSMVKSLQDELNKQLKEYYESFRLVQIGDEGITETTNATSQLGRRVYYMITIPEDWAAFPVQAGSDKAIEVEWAQKVQAAASATSNKVEEYNKTTSKDKNGKIIGASYIQGSVTMTVDDALALIFKHCPKVAELASIEQRKGTSGQSLKVYKTISSITSNNDSMTLHWDVLEFTVPNVTKAAEKNSAYKQWFKPSDTPGENVPKNLYEYDYIFSGKNIDILNFDMKLQNASVALINSLNVGQKSLQTIASGQKDGGLMESKVSKTDVFTQRAKDPVFLPMVNANNFRGNSYIVDGSQLEAKANEEFVRTMADLYATSNVNIKMRIRGNPILMNHMINGLPPHIVPDTDSKSPLNTNSAKLDSSNQNPYISYINTYAQGVQFDVAVAAGTANTSSINPAVFPVFTKVNIYSPKSYRAADVSTDGYGVKFWYDKYYMVFSIDHFFVDGKFEQELTMGAYTIYDNEVSDKALEANTAGATTGKENTTNAKANDSEKTKAGSGLTAPSAAGQPVNSKATASSKESAALDTSAAEAGTITDDSKISSVTANYTPVTNIKSNTTGSALIKKGS